MPAGTRSRYPQTPRLGLDHGGPIHHTSDASGDGWADVIDTMTMYPDVRRKVVRMLAEIRGGKRP